MVAFFALQGLIASAAPAMAQEAEVATMEVEVPRSVGQPYREAQRAWQAGEGEAALAAAQEADAAAQEAGLDADMLGVFAGLVAEVGDETGRYDVALEAWLRTARFYDEAGYLPADRAYPWMRAARSAEAAGDRERAAELIERAIGVLGPASAEIWEPYISLRAIRLRLATPEPVRPEGFVDATPVFRPHPPFGRTALMAGHEGAVIVRFDVDERGRLDDLEIVDAFPPDTFEGPVRATLAQWRYEPATVNGQPVRREDISTILFFRIGEEPDGQ